MADITPPLQTNTALTPSTTTSKKGYGVWIFLIIIVLLVAAAAYYFFVYKTADEPSLYVSANTASPSPLYKVNTASKTFAPVTAPGQDQGSFVTDEVKDATTTYYLIADQSGMTSNLYESVDGAPVMQMTSSPTIKYDLSYDPSSHYFTYLSATLVNPAGFQLDKQNSSFDAISATPDANGKITTENKLASSTSGVQIVPQINAIVVDKADGLYIYSLQGSQSIEIFPSKTPLVFAVSQSGVLGLLNTYTNEIDLYSLNRGIDHVDYMYPEKPLFTPTAISFDGTQVIYTSLGGAQGSFYSRFALPGAKNTVTTIQVTNPQKIQAAAPLKLSYE